MHVVGRGNNVCGDAEPGLNDVAAALAKESKEDSVSATHHRLFIQLISQPDPWHKAVFRGLVQPRRLTVNAGEQESASDIQGWDFSYWSGVFGADCGLDRLYVSRIEAGHALVITLGQRSFEFISQAKIQGKPWRDFPVVMDKETPGGRLLGKVGGSRDAAG